MSENIYENVANKYKNSPALVMLFIASFVMLSIGIWLFIEDTVSSKLGLEQLQAAYGMNIQIFSQSYWIMSLAPQVASIVFFYLYLSSGEKKWAVFAFISQFADFMADQWYRSNGQMFNDPVVFAISGLLTFFYFSVGSEVFITVGFGLVLWLWNPAVRNFKMALDATRATYKPSGKGGGGGGGGGGSTLHKPSAGPKPSYRPTSPKPAASASTRPLYNEPSYHPVGMNAIGGMGAKQSNTSRVEGAPDNARPSWMPENYEGE